MSEPSAKLPPNLEALEAIPPAYNYDAINLPEGTHLDMHFAAHTLSADLGPKGHFHDILQQHDIYIPEGMDWTPHTLALYQKVSDGNKKMFESAVTYAGSDVRNQYNVALLGELFASKVKVDFVEVGYEHPLYQRHVDQMNNSPFHNSKADFEARLEGTKLFYKDFSETNFEREQVILENLGPHMAALTNRYGKLGGKQQRGELEVLMTMGSVHISLATALRHMVAVGQAPDTFSVTPHYDFQTVPSAEIYGRSIRGLETDDVVYAQQLTLSNIRVGLGTPAHLSSSRYDAIIIDCFVAGKTVDELAEFCRSFDDDDDFYITAIETLGRALVAESEVPQTS